MTININELRRLAQAASHPTTKGRWIRLFGERTVYDRMEDGCRGIPVVSTDKHPPSSFEAACLDFIAAANPAAVIELLDRLEESESDCLEQARLNGMGSEREAALMAKLEVAEKEVEIERMRLAACGVAALGYFEGCAEEYISASLNDVLALRAKIEAMEKQEPVGKFTQHPSNGLWEQDGYGDNPDANPLYALPGAKGE